MSPSTSVDSRMYPTPDLMTGPNNRLALKEGFKTVALVDVFPVPMTTSCAALEIHDLRDSVPRGFQ